QADGGAAGGADPDRELPAALADGAGGADLGGGPTDGGAGVHGVLLTGRIGRRLGGDRVSASGWTASGRRWWAAPKGPAAPARPCRGAGCRGPAAPGRAA